MSTFNKKLSISLGAAFIFALVNFPPFLKVIDSITPFDMINTNGCQTYTGLIVSALLFFGLTYATMKGANINNLTKIKHSLYGALIFYFISSPALYVFTRSILGEWVGSNNGCPTQSGVVLHTIVFTIALISVMYLP